jgi:hypothetical protein
VQRISGHPRVTLFGAFATISDVNKSSVILCFYRCFFLSAKEGTSNNSSSRGSSVRGRAARFGWDRAEK